MVAKAGFYALALSAALVMASGAMRSDDAMAQADEATARADEAAAQADKASVGTDEAAAPADDAATRDEAGGQPAPRQQSVAVDRPAKSNLDQSAMRAAPVTRSPRVTLTSTRAIALPKILGSYR